MQSLLAAGSAIGQRMLGIITRAPRLLNTQQIRYPQNPQPQPSHPSHPLPQPPAPVVFHQIQQQHNHGEVFPNFDDCDCQFGKCNALQQKPGDKYIFLLQFLTSKTNLSFQEQKTKLLNSNHTFLKRRLSMSTTQLKVIHIALTR